MYQSIVDPKESTHYGTWNIRTLYSPGKLAQCEFDSYRMDILCISEMQWTSSGKLVSYGKIILFSGYSQDHACDVGFILSRWAVASLLRWKPITDHLISFCLQAWHTKITIIQAYAPTADANNVTFTRRHGKPLVVGM